MINVIEYIVDENGNIISVEEVEQPTEPTLEEKLEWINQMNG